MVLPLKAPSSPWKQQLPSSVFRAVLPRLPGVHVWSRGLGVHSEAGLTACSLCLTETPVLIPKPLSKPDNPKGKVRPMACSQVASHPDSHADAVASYWRCHLITAIRPFSAAGAISYL